MNTGSLYKIIEKIHQFSPPGKKVLQKLIYLIQEKGVNLNYQYTIHYYGPYSSQLDYSIQSLERLGIVELRRAGMSSLIFPKENGRFIADEENDSVLDSNDMEKIQYVLDNFANKTPKELELITTTEFVTKHLFTKNKVILKNDIISDVKKIKEDKFTVSQIDETIELLFDYGYLNSSMVS